MATKEKVKKMSEEDEQKMAMWIRESKGRSSLLPDEKMAERYPVAYSMLCDEQQEQSAKEQPKEDETIDITDSSVVTPSVTVTEPMSVEPTQEEPPVHRVSSKQRRLSLEEYRSVYLPVPKIENRMPCSSVPDSATNSKDGLTFKASQLKRGMTFAKMDSIIRRNAEKAQQAKAYNQPQLTHYELPKQETAPESQKQHTESSISIPSPGLFDTNNPVYDPAEEEFRRRMQKKRGPRL